MVRTLPTILAVDDDPMILALVRHTVGCEYVLLEATTGESALEIAELQRPELVLLDINLPGLDGYEVCRRLKSMAATSQANVIIVTSKGSRAEQLTGYAVGADDYVLKPFNQFELASRIRLHFRLRDALAESTGIAERLRSKQEQFELFTNSRFEELLATQDLTLFAMARIAESRDNDSGQHLLRVRGYAQQLALSLAEQPAYRNVINEQFLMDLFRSSPLHDIGKVGIPDAILRKPGPLTSDEYDTMKTHTVIGANILTESVAHCDRGGFLSMAADIAHWHHERYDGLGYPEGLSGDQIPLAARLVAVVDVFDALMSVRPYKHAFTPERAKRIILDGSGAQFDPDIVQAFLRTFDQLLRIGNEMRDPTQLGFEETEYLAESPCGI